MSVLLLGMTSSYRWVVKYKYWCNRWLCRWMHIGRSGYLRFALGTQEAETQMAV
jgi:hypothetical protein